MVVYELWKCMPQAFEVLMSGSGHKGRGEATWETFSCALCCFTSMTLQ